MVTERDLAERRKLCRSVAREYLRCARKLRSEGRTSDAVLAARRALSWRRQGRAHG